MCDPLNASAESAEGRSERRASENPHLRGGRGDRGRRSVALTEAGDDVTGGDGPRVLIVAVDGLDWGRLDRLIAEGRVPTIGRLRDEGASGLLRSIYPFRSPSVWTSIATGKTEEQHGVHDFLAPGREDRVVVPTSSNMRRVKAFWQILSENDRSVGVISWLVTWPAETVSGYMVSWNLLRLLTHDGRSDIDDDMVQRLAQAVYPPSVLEEIGEVATTTFRGLASADPASSDLGSCLGTAAFLDDPEVESLITGLARNYAGDVATLDMVRRLSSAHEVDVTAVYFRGLDLNCHTYWRFMEPESYQAGVSPEALETFAPVIECYYAKIDSIVGEVLKLWDDDTVVVLCSDHGFAGHRGYAGFEGDVAMGTDMHREDGVIIFSGPGIAVNGRIDGASVLDVTPTLLALVGLPVARDMEGRVLTQAFDPSLLAERPIRQIDTYETGDGWTEQDPIPSPVDEEIIETLRSLGYIK